MSTPVDGGGLPLPEHVADLAERLALTPAQTELLADELRNALAPGVVRVRGAISVEVAERGMRRVLALADALAARARSMP
jgi:hypothetical protein